MSILKKFDPNYKLDKMIEEAKAQGTFVTTRKTQNGIRREFLAQRPEEKEKYKKAMSHRKTIATIGVSLSALTLAGVGGKFIYDGITAPKANIVAETDKNLEVGIKASWEEKKNQVDKILEDILPIKSSSELRRYTKQLIVDINNKKNPENQIQLEGFEIDRGTEILVVTKDKLGNIASYSIRELLTEIKVNQDVQFSQRILKFSLDGEVIAIMKEDGSPIQIDGNYNYDFSEFASLLREERILGKDLDDRPYASGSNEDLIKEGQERYASIVHGLKKENEIEQVEQEK